MTRSFGETVRAVIASVVETLRKLKAGYDAEDRYSKMRIWIIGVLGVDLVGTTLFVVIASSASIKIAAWYEEAFPSNLIVIQNQGPPLTDVELIIDGKYRARLPNLSAGPAGLELDREFRDALDFPPPASYRPKELEIRALGSSRRVELRVAEKR